MLKPRQLSLLQTNWEWLYCTLTSFCKSYPVKGDLFQSQLYLQLHFSVGQYPKLMTIGDVHIVHFSITFCGIIVDSMDCRDSVSNMAILSKVKAQNTETLVSVL